MSKEILLINKPKHWTSNDVVRKIKGVLKVKKVGHAGTLDPLAEGLLILGINKGTKKLNDLLTNNKVYRANIHFGYYTSSYDLESEEVYFKNKFPTKKEIEVALKTFLGEIEQFPPKFSAIKINGKRAHELARNNIDFEIKAKKVSLEDYKIIEFKNNELIIDIKVSKGFYVRSFAYDLGIKLNTYGCLAKLVRTQIGEYKLKDSLEIGEVYDYWTKQ